MAGTAGLGRSGQLRPEGSRVTMASRTTYAPSPDAMAADLEGEAVLLHLGTRRYFRLNETAAAVWALLEEGVGEPEALAARLCDRFEVERDLAGSEVARLLEELEARGLVQRVEAS